MKCGQNEQKLCKIIIDWECGIYIVSKFAVEVMKLTLERHSQIFEIPWVDNQSLVVIKGALSRFKWAHVFVVFGVMFCLWTSHKYYLVNHGLKRWMWTMMRR